MCDLSKCKPVTPEDTLKYILGLDLRDLELKSTFIGDDDEKVTHFILSYNCTRSICPICGNGMVIHDYKERVWRHANLNKAICYIHAKVPRYRCPDCGGIHQVEVPWADPNVSYSKTFMEVAIEHLAHMSLAATSRLLRCSWTMLDDIVGRVVHDHLDNLDLSGVTRIRVDETSAKKRHRYITVVTDVDTGKIVFITKGNDSKTMEEFAFWLSAHDGNPKDIVLMASDFGDSFIKGAREHLPSARNVYDPFHLVQLGNQEPDKDRSKEQVNGQRLKSIRYALLKNTENLSEEESDLVTDISKDNSVTSLSYQMNMSMRESLELDDPDLARMYLGMWVDWVDREGSKNFKALSKTVRKYMDGIILALSSGVNNGYQESLMGGFNSPNVVCPAYMVGVFGLFPQTSLWILGGGSPLRAPEGEPLVRGKVAPERVVAEGSPRQNPESTYRNRIRGRSGRMTWQPTGKSYALTKS